MYINFLITTSLTERRSSFRDDIPTSTTREQVSTKESRIWFDLSNHNVKILCVVLVLSICNQLITTRTTFPNLKLEKPDQITEWDSSKSAEKICVYFWPTWYSQSYFQVSRKFTTRNVFSFLRFLYLLNYLLAFLYFISTISCTADAGWASGSREARARPALVGQVRYGIIDREREGERERLAIYPTGLNTKFIWHFLNNNNANISNHIFWKFKPKAVLREFCFHIKKQSINRIHKWQQKKTDSNFSQVSLTTGPAFGYGRPPSLDIVTSAWLDTRVSFSSKVG